MVSFPPCKINLGLNVTGKRPDGFHDIETCFYPVPWTDVLDIVPAKEFSFALSGNPVPGPAVDNLCVRAYELLNKEFNLEPVAIHLLKCVPTGAGLGGGSADAACTLTTINRLFNLSISTGDLNVFAARLGSDCPFFLQEKAVIGTGRGEVLSAVDLSLKGKYLLIVKPEVHISTSAAYREVTIRPLATDLRSVLEKSPIDDWKHVLKNSFEDHLLTQYPVIQSLKQKLYALGAVYASMSGSGSAVYGIFKDAVNFRKEFESFVCWSGYLD